MHVGGDIATTHLNNIDTDNIITLNTVQEITGDIVFKDDVRVLKNVTADVVNKISAEDWVLRKQHCNITCKHICGIT